MRTRLLILLRSPGTSSSNLPTASLKFGKRPLKQSSLRRSININDDEESAESGGTQASAPPSLAAAEEEDGGPVVIRPSIGRSGSTKLKKRASSSRLSFGPAEADDGERDEPAFTPRKSSSLGQRAFENSVLKKSISQRLPTRPPAAEHDEEDQPRYSKAYLEELQSSTPNTPQSNMSALRIDDGDEMELDASELEGAMVVEASELVAVSAAAPHVLTETEIQVRKERRARLVHEKEFISLDASDDDDGGGGGGPEYISLLPSKQEPEKRLVAEDEDLGEGYDEFVEDGRLSLGKKAEREARRRRKREMAELINTAEGGDEDEESDDSEAERRHAYEEAQTRAGMDGLNHRPDRDHDHSVNLPVTIPKMKALPELAECLARLQSLVGGLEDQVAQKREKMAGLEKTQREFLTRETEIQEILDKAGQKYQAVVGDSATLATDSPLRQTMMPPGLAGDFPTERGLESLGTTPTRPAADGEPFL